MYIYISLELSHTLHVQVRRQGRTVSLAMPVSRARPRTASRRDLSAPLSNLRVPPPVLFEQDLESPECSTRGFSSLSPSGDSREGEREAGTVGAPCPRLVDLESVPLPSCLNRT